MKCQNCGEKPPYDVDWDDPPEGHSHIEYVENPSDEPSFVVEQRSYYCDIECMRADMGDTE